MENTQATKVNLVTIPRSAFLIEKVHNCADCPVRRLAAQKPHSVFARMHAWHLTWWPGWQAHRARMCARTTGTEN
jgi:hypothetical protein